jgi:hypothetical protein
MEKEIISKEEKDKNSVLNFVLNKKIKKIKNNKLKVKS